MTGRWIAADLAHPSFLRRRHRRAHRTPTMQAELHLDLAPDFVGPEALRAEVRVVDGDQREITITVHRPGDAVPIADVVLGLNPDTGELRVLVSADGDASEHRLCLFPLRPAAQAVCPI